MSKEEAIKHLKVIRWILKKTYGDLYDDVIDYAIYVISKQKDTPERDYDEGEDGWL